MAKRSFHHTHSNIARLLSAKPSSLIFYPKKAISSSLGNFRQHPFQSASSCQSHLLLALAFLSVAGSLKYILFPKIRQEDTKIVPSQPACFFVCVILDLIFGYPPRRTIAHLRTIVVTQQ